MTDKLQEDTVSADRKERIIYDPEAWRNGKKSGKKTSSITSRQNFDNEKFTRNTEKVDEGTLQPSGDSKVDSAGPTQSDTISKDSKPKKSNNPQIEFVTGTAMPNGTSSTASGNATASATGRKIAESLVKKALAQVQEGKMGEKAAGDLDFNAKAKKDDSVPFDGPYTKTPSTVVDKSGARHTPMSRVRDLARQAMKKNVKEEVEQIDELSKTTLGNYVNAAKQDNKDHADSRRSGDSDESKWAKDRMVKRSTGIGAAKQRLNTEEHAELEEGIAGAVSGAVLGAMTGGPLGAVAGGYLGHKVQQGANDAKAVKKKIVKEEETRMSKTYTEFMGELDQLVEFVVEETQLQEYNAKDGVYRHKGTYGGGYVDPEGSDDADDKPKAAPAPVVKKGRGRPSGSYGTYKARSAETKAAAAAKSAASKAANKAK